MRHRFGELAGQPERHVAAERVAVTSGIVGGDEALFAGHRHADRTTVLHQFGHPRPAVCLGAQVEFLCRQVAQATQHVVQFVGAAGTASVGQQLQFQLQIGKRPRVEQLAQFLRSQQVAQQITVERQRSGTALGQRAVALVHERRDPVEQQALRERRGLRRVDADDADGATAQLRQHLAQRRHVEHILETLTCRLQQHRERGVLTGHGQQVGRPLPLLPQRRALIGPTARQQQGTRTALAEASAEQAGLRQRRHHQLVDVVGVDDQVGERQILRRFRQAQHDAVVGVHRLHRDVVALHQSTLDGHRPRRVHGHTERTEDAHPPVADLVAEALDNDRAIVGHRAGGLGLLVQVAQHVASGERVERVIGHQRRRRSRCGQGTHFTLEGTQCTAQFQRTSRPVAVPERHLRRHTRRGCDDHTLERDVLDAPRAGPQQERIARAALIDHLLVELTHPRAVGQEHAEQATVGDRAAAHDRQPLAAVAGAQRAVHAVPHQTRAQFIELVAGVTTRQQVEHVVQQVVAELGEPGRTANHGSNVGDSDVGVHAHMGHDLLSQHVERVAQVSAGLDEALAHPLRHHCGLQQIATVFGVERALAGLAHAVPGAADALHPPRHRTRRFHLDDEIDRTHVDAQLEAAGGDDGAQMTALQLIFDDHPLLAGQRAVVRLDELAGNSLLGGEFVEPCCQALGEAAAVAEDDRAAMLQHLRQDARVDAGPHTTLGRRGPHVFHGHHYLDLHLLAHTGVDDGDGSGRSALVAAEEAGDLLQRALRGAEADPLETVACDRLQPFQAEHQVRATLGGGHRVDLVDDHRVHAGQRVGHRTGEHQVQALGRGDQQVGRAARQLRPLAAAGVARAHRHAGFGERHAQPLGRQANAHQRRAQVLLHVERQRPQRRDVEHLDALHRLGVCRPRHEPVDAAEECRERLAAARRRTHQRVLAGPDGGPAVDLRRRRRGERGREPLTHRRREAFEDGMSHGMVGHASRLRQGCRPPPRRCECLPPGASATPPVRVPRAHPSAT
ncbi:unannotated protein [freshwater metagenome]